MISHVLAQTRSAVRSIGISPGGLRNMETKRCPNRGITKPRSDFYTRKIKDQIYWIRVGLIILFELLIIIFIYFNYRLSLIS